MPNESLSEETPKWIRERNRIVGLAEGLMKENGCLAEFKERVKWLKRDYRARTGAQPDGDVRKELYWEAAWLYVDSCVDSTPVEPVEEPEPEPEPEVSGAPEPEPVKIRSLLDPAIFKGKNCSKQESIEWAIENINVDCTAEDAPSQMAWSIVDECRENQAMKFALFTNLLPKIVSKPKEEGSDGLVDDGKVIDLLDQIERACKELQDE